MRKWRLFFLFFVLTHCEKIDTLNRGVVNAIYIKDINLTDKDVFNSNTLNYYYSKNFLYISDNLHKKIFALNSYNRVVFELGNVFDTSTQKQNQSKAWGGILEEMKTEFNTSQQVIEKSSSNTESNLNRTAVKETYHFEEIGKIAIDNEGDLYVAHTFTEPVSRDKKLELLRFTPNGKFLYKIGEEGRDNPPFDADIRIQNFYFDTDNGVWIKYLQNGKLSLRYYSNFGKNILFYTEEKITPIIEGFLEQNATEEKYTIEDIFPINNTRDIMVILDIYKETAGQLQIQKKQILTINKQYILQDIVEIKNLNMQIYGLTNNNQLYGLTYQDRDGYLLEIYNTDGKNIMRSKVNPDINYYTRLSLGVNPDGGLLGVFLKSKDLVFVNWR